MREPLVQISLDGNGEAVARGDVPGTMMMGERLAQGMVFERTPGMEG